MKNILAILSITVSQLCLSQPVQRIALENSCTYDGQVTNLETSVLFSSSSEADDIVSEIVNKSGLTQNFIIRSGNVANASAVIYDSNRYILYNQNFISDVNRRTGSRWGSISILAHEVGHHLNAHTLSSAIDQNRELEADYFSGFILQKMGASLDEAQVAMNSMVSSRGSSTHPPKSERLAAIASGWSTACDNDTNCSTFSAGNERPLVSPAENVNMRFGAIAHVRLENNDRGFENLYYNTNATSESSAIEGAMSDCLADNDTGCAVRNILSGSDCAVGIMKTTDSNFGERKILIASTEALVLDAVQTECGAEPSENCLFTMSFCATMN